MFCTWIKHIHKFPNTQSPHLKPLSHRISSLILNLKTRKEYAQAQYKSGKFKGFDWPGLEAKTKELGSGVITSLANKRRL